MASTAPDAQQRQLLALAAERLSAGMSAARAKASASNYDFVKIKVRLGANLEHYYILSRFLLSRMLTVIALPQHKAVRIALDVKKHLVDHDRLDITQDELEEALFAILRQRGYGGEYVRRYQMVTRFFQQKRPLIILVAGSACTGKSTLAQQLASRLNLPNVLQTDVLYELLRASGLGDLPANPLWRRPLPPGASLLGEFRRECAAIRRALDGDLCKCIRDGKSIIIEGLHLDPGLFLQEFGDPRGEPVLAAAGSWELPPAAAATAMAAVAAEAQAPPAAANGVAAAAAAAEAGPAGLDAAAQQLEGLQLGAAPAGAAASPSSSTAARDATGVRRTASFGDAVPRLSSSAHRQLSPWKDAAASRLRPRSGSGAGRAGDSLDHAVFMLRSVGASADGALGSDADGAPQPVPSPRLAACISLPSMREGAPPPLDLSGGWSSGPEATAGAAGGTHLPPLAEQEAEGDSRSGSQAALENGCSEAPAGEPAEAQQGAAPPAPSSVAAADAAAAAAAGTGPVFVPICLSVPDEEYGSMLQDWLARQPAPAASGEAAAAGDGGADAAAEAACRLRALQAHLRQYGASGVPVVQLSLGDMGQALDGMHRYVLQCIALALGEPGDLAL